MVFRAFIYILLCALVGFTQDPAALFEKAPPDVDKALRGRISKFYQAHVDGKFREAYELVAEDSRDFYFAAEKTKYRGFAIVKISYSDNFTAAKVVVACDTEFGTFGTKFPVKAPLVSHWKLVDGMWYWQAPQTNTFETPAGTMRPGPEPGQASGLVLNAPRVAALQEMVKVDKKVVRVSCSEPISDQVVVSNHLPGVVSLRLDYRGPRAVEVQLDRKELKSGETGVISFRCNPAEKISRSKVIARLLVKQTNQKIPIRITFVAPPTSKQKPR